MKLANKIFPGKNLGEELAKELVEGQVHFVPKELIETLLHLSSPLHPGTRFSVVVLATSLSTEEKKKQFSADQKLSVYHSIMYLLERQQGYDKEEAKKRVESLETLS